MQEIYQRKCLREKMRSSGRWNICRIMIQIWLQVKEKRRKVGGREASETPMQLLELHNAFREWVLKLKSPTRGAPRLLGTGWEKSLESVLLAQKSKGIQNVAAGAVCQALSTPHLEILKVYSSSHQGCKRVHVKNLKQTSYLMKHGTFSSKNRNKSSMSTLTTFI